LGAKLTMGTGNFNPLNAELNPIWHLLALLDGATIVDLSGLRVNLLRFQTRKTGKIILNQFLIYVYPFPPLSPQVSCLSSNQLQKKYIYIFLDRNKYWGGGICPPLSAPKLRLWIKLFSWNTNSLRLYLSIKLHGVISQKKALFIVIRVGTSQSLLHWS
jgi:hypothetical protein